MTLPRRVQQQAKLAGQMMGVKIREERRRNRWHFGALWVAVALLALANLL